MSDAYSKIVLGNTFPFDASDEWWKDETPVPMVPPDWAHAAARGVIADLKDRRGIKHCLERSEIDEDTRTEIIESLASSIRTSFDMQAKWAK